MQHGTGWLLARCLPLLIACVLAGCPSITRPPETRGPDAQTAERLAREGEHRRAAAMYEELARQSTGPAQNALRLQAAEQWLAVGDYAQAQRSIDALGAGLDPEQSRTRTFYAAQIAIGTGHAERALQLLRDMPVANNPAAAAQLLALQARAHFVLGRVVDGARALIAREAWLRDSGALASNRRELADNLRNAAARGASLRAPPGADPLLSGWLELGSVLLEVDRNPFSARNNLQQWRAKHPTHPANSGILDDLLRDSAVTLDYPAQVALLLPLSGRQQAAAVAVRDGFLSAWYQQEPFERPRVRIYDVANADVGSTYLKAIDDGAQFVVGPLTKDDVATAAGIADGRVPVLALNFLGEGQRAPRGFYQFALSPEDEAREVAERVIADGHPRGVALVPSGEWGSRVLTAFADELGALGGELVAQGVYDPSQSDYSAVIQQLLRLSDSRERHARLVNTLGVKLEFEPRRRGDVQFIFIAGQPSHGRLLRPQLRFHYAGNLPTYSTSEAFEPDEVANIDLDGVMFPDMPWMISNDPVSGGLRDAVQQAWPSRATRRGRLYAFGFDAYRLIPVLRGRGSNAHISGMTGRLSVDAEGRVRRALDWAQIVEGRPRELALAEETPPQSR